MASLLFMVLFWARVLKTEALAGRKYEHNRGAGTVSENHELEAHTGGYQGAHQ
jgi:hypothetical protein